MCPVSPGPSITKSAEPFAAVFGLLAEHSFGQPGPVAADRGLEFAPAAGIDRIVDMVDPLHVRSKTNLAREIECQVDAEPTLFGHRIDEMAER